MRKLDELDARVKMLSLFIAGTAVLRAREPLPLGVAVLVAYPLLKRKALSLGLILVLAVGLLGGLDYFFRLLAVAELGLLFAETTEEGEIMASLTRMKVPSNVALSVGLALNGFHSMRGFFREVSEAQASRGMRGGLTSLKSTIVPVMVRALLLGEELGEAIEARGYTGRLRLPYRGKFGLEEALILTASVLLLAVSLM